MNDDSLTPDDLDAPQDPSITPAWWFNIWCVWGIVVGALVAIFDQNLWLAVPWVIGGLLVGRFVFPLFQAWNAWLDFRVDSTAPSPEVMEAVMEWDGEGNPPTPAVKRWLDETVFWATLPLPLFLGPFFGLLTGPVVGSIFGWEEGLPWGATEGALYGLAIGPVVMTFVVSIILAFVIELDGELPFTTRLGRRALIAVSPILVLPFVWSILRSTIARQHG